MRETLEPCSGDVAKGDGESSFENFSGVVVRIDGRSFGIVEFDRTVDEAQYGFFTEYTRNFDCVNGILVVGERVSGLVEKTDQRVLPVAEFTHRNS